MTGSSKSKRPTIQKDTKMNNIRRANASEFPHAMRSRYCKKCGRLVMPCPTTADGSANTHLEFELENGVHWECFQKLERELAPSIEQIKKEAEEAEAKAKIKADADFEAAVQKIMKELEGKTREHNNGEDK